MEAFSVVICYIHEIATKLDLHQRQYFELLVQLFSRPFFGRNINLLSFFCIHVFVFTLIIYHRLHFFTKFTSEFCYLHHNKCGRHIFSNLLLLQTVSLIANLQLFSLLISVDKFRKTFIIFYCSSYRHKQLETRIRIKE